MRINSLNILLILLVILLMTGTSFTIAVTNFNEGIKDKELLNSINKLIIIGKISNRKFIGGYVGSYLFDIDYALLYYNNQDPKIQLIENKVGWVCVHFYNGIIGKSFICAIGDFNIN